MQVTENGIDPITLLNSEQITHYYGTAHYIWYYFIGIGILSAISLFVYKNNIPQSLVQFVLCLALLLL